MISPRHLFPSLLALASLAAPTGAAGERTDGKVELDLYTDARIITPGATFRLAVQYTMEPEWHIYWVNPGDTGFATTLEVAAPEGFTVGPVQYPGPHRFEQPGDLVSYGYEGVATFIVEITAPEQLVSDGKMRFSIHSDWLVCKEACFVGSGDRSIVIRTAASAEGARPANPTRMGNALARLPRKLEELKLAPHRWTGSTANPRFEATFPKDVEFEFFPLLVDNLKARQSEVSELEDGAKRLTISFEVGESESPSTSPPSYGVLRVKQGEEEFYYDLLPTVDE